MKKFYLTIAVFTLFFISCSSTYKVSDFSSKEKYYQDFNNFARNKNVKVTLINDSSFSIDGAAIENDTLYSLREEINSGNLKLALSDTKEINYTSNDYKSASILLKEGDKYQAEQIKMTQDSITFAFTKKVAVMNDVVSTNNVKIINYKSRWLAIPPGLFWGTVSGIVIGGLTGIILAFSPAYSNQPGDYVSVSIAAGAGAGFGIGIILGWLIGNNYTYQFNP